MSAAALVLLAVGVGAGESSSAPSVGIVLTQYNQYPEPTYAPPQPAVPQYGVAPAAVNDAVDSWNGGDTAPATAPQAPGNVLRVAAGQAAPPVDSAATTWNGGTTPAAPAPAGPFGKVGDGLDRVTQPLRNGLDQVDNRVRDAASNLGDKTRQLANDLTEPITGGTTWGGDSPAPAASALPAAPAWNGGTQPALPAAPATSGRSDQPVYSWNDQQPPAPGSTAAPFAASTPQSPAPTGTNGFAGSPSSQGGWPAAAPTSAPQANSQRLDQSLDPRDVGRWDNRQTAPVAASPTGAGQSKEDLVAPPLATGGRYGNSSQQPRSSAPASSLPSEWGADTGAAPRAGDRSAATTEPFGPALGPAGDKSSVNGRTPTIDKRMLNQPANRQLEGVASNQQPAAFPAGPPLAGASQVVTGTAPGSTVTGAAGQGWDMANRNPAMPQMTPTGGVAPATANGPHAMTVLAAWVLLSGSAAGNLYLFWSYLDVRTKYRALVRKTARAVGSRFSAA